MGTGPGLVWGSTGMQGPRFGLFSGVWRCVGLRGLGFAMLV